MDKINKEEFLKRLEDNKMFSDTKELAEERMPVLVYFKDNYPLVINTIFGQQQLICGDEEYDESKFTAMNRAFEILVSNKSNL